ncbi:hypothetical protein Noda2021_11490 [Candidatus Dependentiae bacterium Noda2021]|nr:hypothetical protein Noda2021_11490 [Candidatus Dependentiae bacterium Noda2021]
MRLDRYFKKIQVLVISLFLTIFCSYSAEHNISYQDYFDNYLLPYYKEPLGSTTEQMRKDIIILCLNNQSDAHRKLLLAFNFFHPAVETLQKTHIQKNKKMKLLNTFLDHGHIGPYEYVEHVCALDYYSQLLHVPKLSDVLISHLLNWGVNPFTHAAHEKSQLLFSQRLPTFTQHHWGLDEGALVDIKKIPTDSLNTESVDFFCSKVSGYASQRATFFRDQVQINNKFINDKKFPSLFVLASLSVIKKTIEIGQNNLVIGDFFPTVIGWMNNQNNRKLFFSILLLHPESVINSVGLPYPKTQLDLLNKLYKSYRQLSPLEYLSYRAIIEYLPNFFFSKNMSISALHKVLELGADPRVAFDDIQRSNTNIAAMLWQCDVGRIDLCAKTIIYKNYKKHFPSLLQLLNYMRQNSNVDIQKYLIYAHVHQKKEALEYLKKKVGLTQDTITLLENNNIIQEKIKKNDGGI